MLHGGLPEVGLVAHGVPGRAIFVTVLAVNALGDYLRDALDPRLQNRV